MKKNDVEIGKPKYQCGDNVDFTFVDVNNVRKTYNGVIEVVDAWGTIRCPDIPSYDIIVNQEGQEVLWKHIPETICEKINVREMENM